MNLFYPRVDWRGASTGFVESEFQIFTFLVVAFYRVLGEHVEIARAFNITFFALTTLVLFDFGRRMFSVPAALLAVFFLSFNPLHAYFSRTFQPDALMVLDHPASNVKGFVMRQRRPRVVDCQFPAGSAVLAASRLGEAEVGEVVLDEDVLSGRYVLACDAMEATLASELAKWFSRNCSTPRLRTRQLMSHVSIASALPWACASRTLIRPLSPKR